MFRIIKIHGESMLPEYNDGDYVITSRLPLLSGTVKVNSVMVFKSEKYGILIKKVAGINNDNNTYSFKGTNPLSLSTEEIGSIDKKNIIGSVIFHFAKIPR